MKKQPLGLILLSIILFANITLAQQWSSSGSNIYYNSGKVGIGNSSPSKLLHLSKSPGGTGDPQLLITDTGGDANDKHFGIYVDGGVARLTPYNDAFGIRSGIAIDIGNGNVGMGTTTPQSKLAVNGTITAIDVEVTSTGWPDFVFSPDYNLTPLPEVEQYIQTNGHLPELPSAEDVAANGIALGESQALLLQKIEELTLYVIELNKANQALKARVDGLER